MILSTKAIQNMIFPHPDESMEDFLGSERYMSTFSEISVSDMETQENAKRLFNSKLTPLQRLEMMNILNRLFYNIDVANPQEMPREIIIDRQ
jgi:hypothetical protein